jgi:XTP/dITP diphosphohydrolase
VATQSAAADEQIDIEVLHGTWDLPGARLLDVVATMDRLRAAGGCPWDAEQTHASLAPYLLEEAYEAFQTIEDDDLDALRDELGDVLLQVAFHARMAEERDEEERWSIVDKLVRRHPHVFADVAVTDADEVSANWDDIKAAEDHGRSPLDRVPMAMAALTLAATLQRKAEKLGVAAGEIAPALGDAAAADDPGAFLWSVVAALRARGIDPETALRTHARRFRDTHAGSE